MDSLKNQSDRGHEYYQKKVNLYLRLLLLKDIMMINQLKN